MSTPGWAKSASPIFAMGVVLLFVSAFFLLPPKGLLAFAIGLPIALAGLVLLALGTAGTAVRAKAERK